MKGRKGGTEEGKEEGLKKQWKGGEVMSVRPKVITSLNESYRVSPCYCVLEIFLSFLCPQ